MVYKNFLLRLIFSLLFVSIYLIISFINFYHVFYLVLLIYIIVIFEIFLFFKKYRFIPTIYVLISFIFFLLIDFNDNFYSTFNLFIFIVISFDIFSYLVGKYIGKNQLMKISPNKTLEGFIGGIFISFILSLLVSIFLGFNLNLNLILFISLVIIFAFIGDIIESFYKRKNNLKNSSEFIPGHGGVFDRFDSFLFAIIFYSISIHNLL